MFPGVHARLHPDKAAAVIAETGRTLTYGELERNSGRLAAHLRSAGLVPGDTVAMLVGNELTAFEIYWAAMRSGFYLTAVNHHLAAEEVEYIVNDSGAKALVASAAKGAVASGLLNSTPGVHDRLVFGGELAGHQSYERALADAVTDPVASQPAGAQMLYSSGTTGRPKGIRFPLPTRQVDEPGDAYVGLFGPWFGISAETVYLSPAPIYHAGPLRFCDTVQALGGTVVMMERFDAEAALTAIERYRTTHLQMVPTMFVRLLKLPAAVRAAADVSSLEVAIHAAAPCPPDVKREMIAWWGPILTEYFGATESNGATIIGSEDWLRKPGSVGKPFLGIPHVCAEDGAEQPAGVDGVVYFERDELPFRYHNDDEKTAAAQHPFHPTWTTVGDIGHLDADGFLFPTDRKAFVIISGGVNIYPQEIENALALHPLVFDVAVFGVPDPEMGQIVAAAVQLAPGAPATAGTRDELLAYLADRIARFKLPRLVDFVDELPRTETGKLAKGKLAAAYR